MGLPHPAGDLLQGGRLRPRHRLRGVQQGRRQLGRAAALVAAQQAHEAKAAPALFPVVHGLRRHPDVGDHFRRVALAQCQHPERPWP